MTDGAAVAREEAVTSALLEEASQYRTVQTLQRWPLVTNAAAAVTDRYHTLKEGDATRAVLNISEEAAGAICRLALLPAVRSPVVKTPLRMADWFGANGADLLQKAIPRLTDTKQPLRPNAELLLSLLLVPLTLTVALSRDLLQLGASTLVRTFPGLAPAAAGFSEKSLAGQCVTALLLLWVHLPLQLVSRPVETAVCWAREVAGAVADELSAFVVSVAELAVQAVSWAAATAQTVYYVLFVMTGLEPLLAALASRARALLHAARQSAATAADALSSSAPVSGLAERVASSDLAAVRWARELWCGADAQRAEGERGAAGTGASSASL